MAEEVALPANRLWKIPDAMPHDVAAAFILTYGTSYHALKDRGHLKAGETLLVLGAAGGVGLSAVELGKAMGARVIAACSTQEKVDLAIKHGADAGVVYGRGPFDKDGQRALGAMFKEACGPNGADVIYDAVGGDYAEPALRAIAWEGRYLVIGFAAGEIPKIPLNLALMKGCDIVGVFWGTWTQKNPGAFAASIDELLALYAVRQDQAARLGPLPAGQGRRRHRPPGQPPRHGQGRHHRRLILTARRLRPRFEVLRRACMAGRLDGKVAVITGGVSGIGLGTVELFVAEGARVVAADIQDEKGRMLEQRFRGAVRYARCDVTVEADIAAAIGLAEGASSAGWTSCSTTPASPT